MLRGQLRPILFPYTTLFRSVRVRRPAGTPVRVVEPLPARAGRGRRDGSARLLYDRVGDRRAGQDVVGDRKSTRLNSSHPSISYAVFCLKKKIKCKNTD